MSLYLWDFGGQTIFHGLHSAFFHENCVYVLVVDSRHEQAPDEWLHQIRHLAGSQAKVLLVMNWYEGCETRQNETRLIREFPDLLDRVLIARTDYIPPPADELPVRFEAMLGDLTRIDDIYDQAIHIFLTMARCLFFYDVNKRMGRFMMNGHLLQYGYPAINVPAKRQLEFNTLMLAFYSSGDECAMNLFLRSCMDERVLRIML